MTSEPRTSIDWVYDGIWSVVTAFFRVPRSGPSIPAHGGDRVEVFHPATGYLGYSKLGFSLVMAGNLALLLILWAVITSESGGAGLLFALFFGPVWLLVTLFGYVAIHLRYDNMWYLMTDRSLRIRHGVVVITEVTLTFENIQNVKVRSGPVQRLFGIGDVIVETAGAGEDASDRHRRTVTNQGLFQGVGDAHRIRDLVMARVRRSKTTGLGDESFAPAISHPFAAWTPAHLALLREIRDEAARLS